MTRKAFKPKMNQEQESNQDVVEVVNVEVKEHNQQIHTNPTVLSTTFYFISFFLVYIYMSIWFTYKL